MTKFTLPFTDKNVWDYLRWNSYLSEQHKLLYVATPKVACTSLKWWFAALEGYSKTLFEVTDSAESDPDLVIHDTFYKVAPSVTGLMPEALAEPIVSDKYFRFAVVRNPYKRLFSAWQSKLLLREPLQIEPYLKYDFFWRPIENATDIAMAFEGFVEHLASNEAPVFWDHHWTPQVNLLRPDLITYSKLTKIEDPKDLYFALTEHLGTQIPDPFKNHRVNESLIPYLPEFITKRAAVLIRSLYAEDFKTLDYDSQLPGAKEKFSNSQLDVALRAIRLIRGRHQRLDQIRVVLSGQIVTLNQAVTVRDGQIANLNQTVADLEGQIASLNQTVTDLERQIANLNRVVAERDEQIAGLNQTVADRDGQIVSLNQTVADRDSQIASLKLAVTEREGQITAILNSRSWRLTKPLRFFSRNLIIRPYRFFRRLLSNYAHWFWRHLPISSQRKQRIKTVLFNRLPFLFGWMHAYRTWKSINSTIDRSSAAYINVPSKPAQKTSNDSEYTPLLKASPLKNKPVKLICFYLPQFHPIPENDVWWGEGFTEWTNVIPAQPQFVGHYQPHEPDELGCYSLLDQNVQRRQIELAKLYGIEGFCFYFYWFGGKRLLETPVQNYLNDNSLDLPFCLCWANENWTRRWDGLDSEVLIAQKHSPEDDLAFIGHIAQYMRDSRYIRIDGRPLLLVYRPSLLPSAKDTAKRWRNWCRENGIGEIYLAYTQSFESVDPAKYGFDAAIEFPPNNSAPPNITDSVTPLSKDFGCSVYDWRYFVERSEKYKRPRYKLFRGVCPSWDNTARRKNHSTVFLNSSPALYQRWLENAIRDTIQNQANPDERLIFINAWNEWAEGAHLEPDRRYGYAWLQATRDALLAVKVTSRRIVVVSHDAHPHGAQLLALNMAGELCQLGFSVEMIILGDGVLLPKFKQVASVHCIDLDREPHDQVLKRLRALRANGSEVAIANTTVSGLLVPLLKQAGFTVVSLIHELPGILNSYQLYEHARAIADNSDCVVFPAAQVKAGFEGFVGHLLKQAVIRPQGLYMRSPLRAGTDRQLIRSKIRKQLGLASDTRIILSAGYADYRKGLDLFIDACLKVINKYPKVVALWIGHFDQKFMDQQMEKIDAAGVRNRFIFPGRVEQPQEYYVAADVYALTSREDPFPSVVLEAYDALTPVVAFEGCGGFEEFLRRDCGVLVPAFDIDAYAKELVDLIDDQDKAHRYAEQGRAIVEQEFSFRHYLFDLLEFAGKPLPRVSVIVPNYNYGHYLTERLSTIVRQTVPIYELIVLDDASTDDSLQIAKNFLAKCDIPSMLVANESNSGSVFRQWVRGIGLARGDFVWIAEADDLADPEFLESVLPSFQWPEVVMSYTQSRQIAEDGTILCEHYLDYVADIDRDRWTRPYLVDGIEEIKKALYLKNTIPNVSAVVFRRDILSATLKTHGEEIASFRFAGDWVLYLRLLEHGAVAFCPLSLNSHRRHQRSVTIGGFGLQQLREITKVQRDTIRRFALDEKESSKASAYVQQLYEQFCLANHTHPAIQDYAEFKSDVPV